MAGSTVVYHSVHFYTKNLQELEHYKSLEKTFNVFLKDVQQGGDESVKAQNAAWFKASGEKELRSYKSQGQDLVEQLISGVGWRITASYYGSETRSVVVASPDARGAKFIITAPTSKGGAAKKQKTEENYDHFKVENLDRFFANQADREGCAVLGFQVKAGECQSIFDRYTAKHPALAGKGVQTYKNADGSEFKVVEVFAYYSHKEAGKADKGTILRFTESGGSKALLPGLEPVDAEFVLTSEVSAYFDHWVSNVIDRKQFLATLEDCLGFTPKVDFNAGVVAAGEAIIESTVTGNAPAVVISSPAQGLVNQEQVYLPINNSLSAVGHVQGYLNEIGQGIQHLASRVENLVEFIQRVNTTREATGQGFCFLNIPPSYYGRLVAGDLEAAGLDSAAAKAVMDALFAAELVSKAGLVNLDITDEQIAGLNAGAHADALKANIAAVTKAVRKGIYSNMYSLLKDQLSEATYISIVRNKVLVDIQGNDVLYQIFTANILQKEAGQEAPFLEFIQRVCSEQKDENGVCKAIKPGCGGFGIRNFLTLFLSIEVSKAMRELEEAHESKNDKLVEIATRKVQAFTDQLDVSNPVLTQISDAMTLEGDLLIKIGNTSDAAERAKLQAEADKAKAAKEDGNKKLQAISDEYKAVLSGIRTEFAAAKSA